MNDRFKFRVWDKELKKYSTEYCLDQDGNIFKFDEIGYCNNQCIIQFCTGLRDSKGELIFEGDIVTTAQSLDSVGEVFFDKTRWEIKYSTHFKGNLYYYACSPKEIKIIGNIFDNPELLEK